MVCESCGGPLGAAGGNSPVCLACSAIETLNRELRSPWPSASVRAVATDLLVSSARQVRALRVTTCRFYKETAGVEPGEALPYTEARERAREAYLKAEEKPKEEESYSYTEETESPKAVSATPAGVTPKAKGAPGSRAEARGRSRSRLERGAESSRKRTPSPRRNPGDTRGELPRQARIISPREDHHGDRARDGRKKRERHTGGPEVDEAEKKDKLYLHERHLVLHDHRESKAHSAQRPKRWRRHRK